MALLPNQLPILLKQYKILETYCPIPQTNIICSGQKITTLVIISAFIINRTPNKDLGYTIPLGLDLPLCIINTEKGEILSYCLFASFM